MTMKVMKKVLPLEMIIMLLNTKKMIKNGSLTNSLSRIVCVSLLIGMMFCFQAGAQTVEEVVEKHNEAMGGLDAFNQIGTAKMTGTVNQQSMEMPIITQIINNKATRTDIEVMGYKISNVYYNGTGWKQNHFEGIETPTEITGAELIDAKAQTSLVNHLMDYQNRGHRVKLVGKENVEGVECYKINLINKDDGKETSYYISASDFMLIKSVTPRELQGRSVDVETFYSDFEKINGLIFAKPRVQTIMGQEFASIKLDKIELDVPIDEKIFQK